MSKSFLTDLQEAANCQPFAAIGEIGGKPLFEAGTCKRDSTENRLSWEMLIVEILPVLMGKRLCYLFQVQERERRN
jgi:hypothetical protein